MKRTVLFIFTLFLAGSFSFADDLKPPKSMVFLTQTESSAGVKISAVDNELVILFYTYKRSLSQDAIYLKLTQIIRTEIIIDLSKQMEIRNK